MAAGAVPTGPMDAESPRSITSALEETSPDPVSIRWIVLVVITIALVLDLADVLPVPIADLLELLPFVL